MSQMCHSQDIKKQKIILPHKFMKHFDCVFLYFSTNTTSVETIDVKNNKTILGKKWKYFRTKKNCYKKINKSSSENYIHEKELIKFKSLMEMDGRVYFIFCIKSDMDNSNHLQTKL